MRRLRFDTPLRYNAGNLILYGHSLSIYEEDSSMNARSVLSGLFCIILSGGVAACATEEAATKSSNAGPASRTSGAAATGTSSMPKSLDTLSDSLNACLARIPKDSSSGARMLAENSCRRDEAVRTGTASSSDRASAGAQDDTLQACMGRIPKASTGQRMLAEESCKRDEATRK